VLFHSPVPQPEVQGGAGLHGCELLQREDRLVSEGGHQGGQRDRVQRRDSGVPTRRLQGQHLPQIWNGAVLPQLKGQECQIQHT